VTYGRHADMWKVHGPDGAADGADGDRRLLSTSRPSSFNAIRVSPSSLGLKDE